jgi:hypothetical protein
MRKNHASAQFRRSYISDSIALIGHFAILTTLEWKGELTEIEEMV